MCAGLQTYSYHGDFRNVALEESCKSEPVHLKAQHRLLTGIYSVLLSLTCVCAVLYCSVIPHDFVSKILRVQHISFIIYFIDTHFYKFIRHFCNATIPFYLIILFFSPFFFVFYFIIYLIGINFYLFIRHFWNAIIQFHFFFFLCRSRIKGTALCHTILLRCYYRS